MVVMPCEGVVWLGVQLARCVLFTELAACVSLHAPVHSAPHVRCEMFTPHVQCGMFTPHVRCEMFTSDVRCEMFTSHVGCPYPMCNAGCPHPMWHVVRPHAMCNVACPHPTSVSRIPCGMLIVYMPHQMCSCHTFAPHVWWMFDGVARWCWAVLAGRPQLRGASGRIIMRIVTNWQACNATWGLVILEIGAAHVEIWCCPRGNWFCPRGKLVLPAWEIGAAHVGNWCCPFERLALLSLALHHCLVVCPVGNRAEESGVWATWDQRGTTAPLSMTGPHANHRPGGKGLSLGVEPQWGGLLVRPRGPRGLYSPVHTGLM